MQQASGFPKRREAPLVLHSWQKSRLLPGAPSRRPTKSGSARPVPGQIKQANGLPNRREAPLALRSWQKSRLLPAANEVRLRPASAGPNKTA